MLEILLLCVALFVVAGLYASVGHGGASGYLFVLTTAGFALAEVSTTALLLNLIVASFAYARFRAIEKLTFRFAFPWFILSIPLAFVGAKLKLHSTTFSLLLALALLFVTLRLLITIPARKSPLIAFHPVYAMIIGGLIGLVSGMIGIGGGIFLSPILLFTGWGSIPVTAALSALFILVNSGAGLMGRIGTLQWLPLAYLPLMGSAVLGGWIGAKFGASRFTHRSFRIALGVVLLIATIKLVMQSLG